MPFTGVNFEPLFTISEVGLLILRFYPNADFDFQLYAVPDHAAKTYVGQAGPAWKVYVNQTLFAHPRTLGLGVKYPKISQEVWTAIQAALSGTKSVQDALSTAQSKISTILKS